MDAMNHWYNAASNMLRVSIDETRMETKDGDDDETQHTAEETTTTTPQPWYTTALYGGGTIDDYSPESEGNGSPAGVDDLSPNNYSPTSDEDDTTSTLWQVPNTTQTEHEETKDSDDGTTTLLSTATEKMSTCIINMTKISIDETLLTTTTINCEAQQAMTTPPPPPKVHNDKETHTTNAKRKYIRKNIKKPTNIKNTTKH